jgi:hypothetical protein
MPPRPAIAARTCPTVPKVPAEAVGPQGGTAVVVTVSDYLSLAPLAGVRVDIFHGDICTRHGGCRPSHPHPADQLHMFATTDNQGRVTFAVPDLEYSMHIPEQPVPGYLTYSTIYNMGKQKCHELTIDRHSANRRIIVFDRFLVPERMLTIRTRDDAIAAAMQDQELVTWLRDHQDAKMTVRGEGSSWQVGFGYGDRFKRLVHVNAFDGSAAMLGRWN